MSLPPKAVTPSSPSASPQASEAERAFEAGNYRRVTELAQEHPDDAVIERIFSRLSPHPLTRYLFLLTALLLLTVTVFAYTR